MGLAHTPSQLIFILAYGLSIYRCVMLSNTVKTAIRNILQHKGYSFINIAGLAVSMTSFIFILLWIQDELSFDRHHSNIDSLYIVNSNSDRELLNPGTPAPLGPALEMEIPEVINSARVLPIGRFSENKFRIAENGFVEEGVWFYDPSLFELFDFKLKSGSISHDDTDFHSIILTESMARKYFGQTDPVGQTMLYSNNRIESDLSLRVMAVIFDISAQSHLRFDCLIPLDLGLSNGLPSDWKIHPYRTYVQLAENVASKETMEKWAATQSKYSDISTRFNLSPVKSIHLTPQLGGSGDRKYVTIFTLVAIIIILIACTNYMNLTTAQSAARAREIGLRKVVGGTRASLMGQIIGESILTAFFAMLASIILVEILLPVFNNLVDKDLSMEYIGRRLHVITLIGMTFIIGVLAGLYPAFHLASHQPAIVLRRAANPVKSGTVLRRILVVFQFSLSIFLIIGTSIIYRQLHFMRSQDFVKEDNHILTIPMEMKHRVRYEAVQQSLLHHPQVVSVTAGSNRLMGDSDGDWKQVKWGKELSENLVSMHHLAVLPNFAEIFGLKIINGRFFNQDLVSDSMNIVLNQTAARLIGKGDPIGEPITIGHLSGQVIGVIEDFHYSSLHNEIEPLAIYQAPEAYKVLFIKMTGEEIAETVKYIKSVWKQYNFGYTFEYYFLDDRLDRFYKNEENLGKLFNLFTFLAIFISCLGLLGLASFLAQQKTKEIGVRKVLGASATNVILLLSKQFTKSVVVANLIAWPLAYFIMNQWLQNYAYRTDMVISTYIISALLALVVSLITVGFQAMQAALTNPIQSLKHE